ncbi:MAG: hypothetical protein ACREPI_00035, partial [Candidatus Dormibacterales bacterium]
MSPYSVINESWIEGLPRRSRRPLVLVALAGLPAMYAWAAFPWALWGPVSFLLTAATLAGALVLYRYGRDRADSRAALDGRQGQLRDRALVLSYQVLSAVVVLTVAAAAVAVLGMGRVLRLDAPVVGAAALTVAVVIPLLPAAALAG